MSSKIVKKLCTLVLSATLLVSASVTAFAATCTHCGSTYGTETGRELDDTYFESPDYHRLEWIVEYRCEDCHRDYEQPEYEYEEHSYQWTNEGLSCTVCGDTYSR